MSQQKIDELTTSIQKDCHKQIEMVKKLAPAGFRYQDAANVYIFHKMAELLFRIQELENQSQKNN
jgi:hypothetical protein